MCVRVSVHHPPSTFTGRLAERGELRSYDRRISDSPYAESGRFLMILAGTVVAAVLVVRE